jgi:hypothetical protein
MTTRPKGTKARGEEKRLENDTYIFSTETNFAPNQRQKYITNKN